MSHAAHVLTATLVLLTTACSSPSTTGDKAATAPAGEPRVAFKVDPSTSAVVSGRVDFAGQKPAAKLVNMSSDIECEKLHPGGKPDDAIVINANGTVANVFVYVTKGLEGLHFDASTTPIAINQNGCGFTPRVMGIQVDQPFSVTNTDPVTHNINPMAQTNRAWNYSQSPGDPPITRRFQQPEIMVPVKCNIHRWMRAWIGVVDHPYFAVSGTDGKFRIPNLPPGDYTIGAWHEKFGTQEAYLSVSPAARPEILFTFKGE